MLRLTSLLVLAALVLPAAASAKGPTEATISGPAFSKTVSVLGDGSGAGPGGDLTQESGFFPAAFGQSPDPMQHRRPAGRPDQTDRLARACEQALGVGTIGAHVGDARQALEHRLRPALW